MLAIFVTDAKGSDELPVAEAISLDFLPLALAVFAIPVGIWFVKSDAGSLPRRGYLDTAITPTMKLLLCMGMLLLGSIGVWWGKGHAPTDSIEQKAWMYAGSMIAQLPVILIYVMLRRRCYSKHITSTVATAFIVFVPMTLGIAGVGHMIFSVVGWESQTELGHTTLEAIAAQPWGTPALVIVLCVTLGAGIIEEVMYRGLILPLISTMFVGKTMWKPVIVTSIFFTLMHLGAVLPSAMPGLFVLSIGLCWARVRSGGVLAPAIIHVLFNAMNIAIVYSTEL